MRVFHGPVNIAGAAGVLAKAQRAAGIEAFSYCLPSDYHYQVDRILTKSTSFDRSFEMFTFLFKERWRFDIFQFYFGNSLTFNNLWDVAWLKKLGKKVFFYFCGCDVRNSKTTIAKYEFSACRDHWPMACSAQRKKAISTALRYADGIFVSTPDLLEFVPGSILLPQPIDMEQFRPLRDQALAKVAGRAEKQGNILIAHAPSDRMIKGSGYLEQAVQDLQRAGLPLELRLIENQTYEEALRLAAEADIVVDQLLIGAYGTFAVEMMALGKPVVCYIRDDLRPHYPATLPIISANPKTIGPVLKKLIDNPANWLETGQAGIKYVEQIHDSLMVTKTTLQAYRKSLQSTRPEPET